MALEGGKEFDKILGLGLLLDKALRLLVILLKDGGIGAVPVGEQVDDFLD